MQNAKNQREEVKVKKLYGNECLLPKDDFIKQYHINIQGLSSQEAELRLNKYGPNEIKQTKPKKWYNYLLESLFSPFNSILLRNCCNFILHRCLFT